MLHVGLTGGLASGKSFVARELGALGCHIIQADELGHKVLASGAEAFAPVVSIFGEDILDAAGEIDRRKLGARVFANPEELERLNAIVHPAVGRRERLECDAIAAADPAAIVVVEAAILVETKSYLRFDRLIVVACRPEQQLERAVARGTYSREEGVARLSRQLPLAAKVAVADYVIDTSGAQEETREQTRAVYRSLRSLQA